MNDPLRRALRTWLQAFLGSLITSGVLSAASADGVVDWSALKKALIAAAAGAVVALITFVQNHLEDSTAMPAILKAPASGGENPVPDPGPARDERGRFVHDDGAVDAVTALVMLLLVVAIMFIVTGGDFRF